MNVTEMATQAVIIFGAVLFAILVGWIIIRKEVLHRPQSPVIPPAKDKDDLLPLRLQANERMIVFIDRINPVNLLLRLHQPGISVHELHGMILNELRQEYQHNVGQQLYIRKDIWDAIQRLKDDTLAMINNAVHHLPENATGVDISKMILSHMATTNENPYDLAIAMLKADIHKLF